MNSIKYVGMDVHKSSIVNTVLNDEGKQVMESIVETKAQTILDFIKALRGTVWVTFEEGTHAAWLYDLLYPHVAKLIVCDPRKNKLLLSGNKADKVDAHKLAQLLRAGLLSPVYHGEHGTRKLKELARNYSSISADCTRVKNRIKAIFRSRAIDCEGETVYQFKHRDYWLNLLKEEGVRSRAHCLMRELDYLLQLCLEARQAMVEQGRKHKAYYLLSTIPYLGPIRTTQIIAAVDSPNRFRAKRPFWSFIGLAVQTKSSADYQVTNGHICKTKKRASTRGLNQNCNKTLKQVFKSAAVDASRRRGHFKTFYEGLIAKGMRPEMARLTLARKIAAISLAVWKTEVHFDAGRLIEKTS